MLTSIVDLFSQAGKRPDRFQSPTQLEKSRANSIAGRVRCGQVDPSSNDGEAVPATCRFSPCRLLRRRPDQGHQFKLEGLARDDKFLNQIIFAGALDVCIDGLNEAAPDARVAISNFLSRFRKANVIVASQPSEWKPPAQARVFTLLPLTKGDVQAFLEKSVEINVQASETARSDALERIPGFLERALSTQIDQAQYELNLSVLSNPFDASIVAQMLVDGHTPELYAIVEQQIEIALTEYRETHSGNSFPLEEFARALYQASVERKERELELSVFDGIEVLAKHRIVVIVRRGPAENERRWLFRHSRFRSWFLAKAMLAMGDKYDAHLGDPRFAGAYDMLAAQLPRGDAEVLREALIEYACLSNDVPNCGVLYNA